MAGKYPTSPLAPAAFPALHVSVFVLGKRKLCTC